MVGKIVSISAAGQSTVENAVWKQIPGKLNLHKSEVTIDVTHDQRVTNEIGSAVVSRSGCVTNVSHELGSRYYLDPDNQVRVLLSLNVEDLKMVFLRRIAPSG